MHNFHNNKGGNKMKKYVLLTSVVLLISILLIAGCGNESGKSGDETSADSNGETYVIKYAHNQQTDSPQDKGANLFKEKVEELSEGQIEVQVYPSNQLGEQRELIEQTQNGQIELTQQSFSILSNFAPVMTLHDLPFLYSSEDVLWDALDNDLGDIFNEALSSAELHNLGFMSGGPKQFTADKALETLEDFKGVKIRALPAPIVMETMKSLGASPTPVEFSELYNSLQQGVVDGQENPAETIYNFKLYEVQDYMTITDHAWMTYANVMNKNFFNSLPEDLQKNVEEAMEYASTEQIKIMQEEEEELRNLIQEQGMEIIELSEEEKEPLKEATLGVQDKFGAEIGEEELESILSAVEKADQ